MTFLVTSQATGEPIGFYVRVVFRGDGYGLFRCADGGVGIARAADGKHACVHDKDEPMVEFYDSRHPHDPVEFGVDNARRGQFVSRYYLSTLLADAAGRPDHIGGIALDGSVPAWTLDKASFQLALAYAQGVVAGRKFAPKPLLMHAPGDEVRCLIKGGGKAKAVYVRRDGVPVGCGEVEDGPDALYAVARMASVNALDASGVEAAKASRMFDDLIEDPSTGGGVYDFSPRVVPLGPETR